MFSVREAAVVALADVGAEGQIPRLERLLSDKSPRMRTQAAVGLVRVGSDAGLEQLFTDSVGWAQAPLFALNRLRKPGLWEKLGRESRRAPYEGDLLGSLGRIREETGLRLETPAGVTLRQGPPVRGCRYPHHHAYGGPLEDFGRRFGTPIEESGWGYWDVVLEDDRIRVLSRRDALSFWRAWWEQEKK